MSQIYLIHKVKIKLILFLLLSLSNLLSAQNRAIDSLKTVLENAKQDTTKAITLNELSRELYLIGHFDSALILAKQALTISDTLLAKTEVFKNRLIYFTVQKMIAKTYGNIGNIYLSHGNYPEALKNHLTSLGIRESLKDEYGIAGSNLNIGIIYGMLGNLDEAKTKYFIALNIFERLGDKKSVAAAYNNIGNVYSRQGDYERALENYLASLKIREQIQDKIGVATAYSNIGAVFSSKADLIPINSVEQKQILRKALINHLNALRLREEMGDKAGVANSYLNLSATYAKLDNYKNAMDFGLKSLSIAKEVGELRVERDMSENLSAIYERFGEDKKALEYYKIYIVLRDSLLNEENTKKTIRLEMNYEFEKKEAATKLEQEKKEAVSAAENKKQKVIIYSVCGVLVLVFGFAVYAYRSYLQKQRANVEITEQKKIIEEKQKEIIESIQYAKRIQQSIIPSEKFIDRILRQIRKKPES